VYICISLTFVAGVSVVAQWFTTRRGLAIGLAVSGSGLGQFAISLTTGTLIDIAGWRGALRYLALISVGGITIAAIMIKRRLPRFQLAKSESSLHFFHDLEFCKLYAGVLFGSLGTNMQFVHLYNYALVEGISASDAVLIVAFMGIGSALGRIILGYLADIAGKIRMFQVCFIFAAISTFCWIGCTVFGTIVLFALCFGFFGGGVISLIPSVSAALYGTEKQGTVYGLVLTATALGNVLSSPIAGFIFDAYRVYYPAIIVAGGFIVFALIFILALKTEEVKELRNMDSHPDVNSNTIQELEMGTHGSIPSKTSSSV
jgi:OFA family oxalate/formate antiporter-like MFS transporter